MTASQETQLRLNSCDSIEKPGKHMAKTNANESIKILFCCRKLGQAGGQEKEVDAGRNRNGGPTAGHQSHGQQRQSDAGQAGGQ